MKQINKDNILEGFHAVDFMRATRRKLSDLYEADRQQYLDKLKRAKEEFSNKRVKPVVHPV